MVHVAILKVTLCTTFFMMSLSHFQYKLHVGIGDLSKFDVFLKRRFDAFWISDIGLFMSSI